MMIKPLALAKNDSDLTGIHEAIDDSIMKCVDNVQKNSVRALTSGATAVSIIAV